MFGVGWPPVRLATPDPGPEDCGCGPSCGPCTANFGEGAPLDLEDVRLGSGLPGFQDATGYPDFEVILSAGPKEEQSDGIPHSCDPDNAQTCSLYRIVIRSGRALVQRVRGRFEDHGYVQPSISPDGSEVAYIVKGNKADGQKIVGLAVTELPGGPGKHRRVWEAPGGASTQTGPQWPTWWDDSTLLFDSHFNRAGGPEGQDHRIFEVSDTGGTETQFLPPAPSLPGFPSPHPDYIRPRVRWSDSEVFTRAGGGRRVVAQRKSLNETRGAYPAVAQFDASGSAVGEQQFDTASLPDGTALATCQHPTWSPSGSQVACFGHEPAMTPYGGGSLRPLYRFERGPSGDWLSTGLLFSAPAPAALNTQFGGLFPPPAGPGTCFFYNFKYPRWVLPDWVVTTLYCERDKTTIDSRTVLVSIPGGQVLDLVQFVEASEGAARNSLRGHTGTGPKSNAGFADPIDALRSSWV